METTSALIAFTLAAALLTITPGVDTALVLRTAAAEGPMRAFKAGTGIVVGVLIWAIAVAIGLGPLFKSSWLAYTILRWAGAAYLVYLGWSLVRQPRHGFDAAQVAVTQPRSDVRRSWFVRGLLTNLLNPKMGVFYVTFLPQFVPAHYAHPIALMVLFGAIHAALGLNWFAVLILATHQFTRIVSRPSVIGSLDRATGVLLIAIGARLAI